jgi:membrane-associated phospholipid phosphatase
MKYSTTVIKFFCFLFFPYHVFAQDKTDSISFKSTDPVHNYFPAEQYFQQPVYKKPRPFSFLTNVPGDLLQIAKSPFEKQNLRPLVTIAGTTALLLLFDNAITKGVGSASNRIGMEPEAEFDELQIHKQAIFKLPDNLNSSFYQMGEGTTTFGIAGGFFIYGKIAHDNRALQTASDLTEAFLSMGITIQALKRITGRQAPFMAAVPGGRWQPFPSFSKYQRYTVNYDAFPSGHLATMMATITVLAENYPEKKWIRPVGYLLTGLTGWSMINNKVHWASDFPLGLAIGYLSGKIACNRHHKKELMRESLPLQ